MASMPLPERKRALLNTYLRGNAPQANKPKTIARRPCADSAPLSYGQEQLWVLDQMEPGSLVYNESYTMRIRGILDAEAIEWSLNETVRRHEILRTTFTTENGRPIQVIAPELHAPLSLEDLTALAPRERDSAAQRIIEAEAHRSFDLASGPLLRAALVRHGTLEHILIVTMHHILCDEWSLGILTRELGALYEARVSGKPSPLPALPIQYADFAVWQREQIHGEILDTQLAYWKRQLADAPVVLELPTDHPRSIEQTARGAMRSILLPASLATALKSLSQREGVTLYMTLLAAFQTLIGRYTQQEDFLVGSVIANRNRPETENLIGFFVNTIVLRADLKHNPTFRELLARVREVALGAYSNRDAPFEQVVAALQPARHPGRNPLFQALISLGPPLPLLPEGWSLTDLHVSTNTSKFDLSFELDDRPEGLAVRIEYNTELFEAATIARMAGHWQTLLEGIVAHPERHLADLPLLTDAERQQLLVEWNATATDYPRDVCVHRLFEEQADRTPDRIALIAGNRRWTFAEVDRRANQLAWRLKSLGVGAEIPVALCMKWSPEMIVGLLGILKAGGYYVPLDPTYPHERLAYMLQDSRASVVVLQPEPRLLLSGLDAQIVALDDTWSSIAQHDTERPPCEVSAEGLAYVMYTSGSTGRPKGVAVPHRAITRLLFGVSYMRFGPAEVFLPLAPITFDASTFEIWGALLHGAPCVLIPDHVPVPSDIARLVREHGVTTIWLTASLFNAFVDEAPDAFRGIRQILTGGEALSVAHIRRAQEALPDVRFINGYGPTESTTFACCCPIPRPLPTNIRSIPIGRPIGNTEIYILDPHGRPVPVGIAGELHIGGDGLAREYLNLPEVTAAKFVEHPFNPAPGARLYKTGDLARYLPDGEIEFLGRLDQQVKIRGFRIEPGEIEAALTSHPDICAAIVVAHEDEARQKRLDAYVVPSCAPGPPVDDLITFLRTKLPAYMIPATFTTLDALPVTANGKVDLSALPAPTDHGARRHEVFVAPSDRLHRQLIPIWEALLSARPIGIRDNFFDLGGDSLGAAQLIYRIEQTFGRKVPFADFYAEPTIEHLAAFLRQPPTDTANQDASPLMKIQVSGAKRPFFFLHGRWLSGGAYCWRIAEALGAQQPFYALQPIELNEARRFPTIEAVAAQYVSLIRTVEPDGPYLLGGYCNGGVIAYEMGRQLLAQGSQVDALFLIDTTLLPARLRLARRCISALARWGTGDVTRQLQAYISLRLGYIRAKSAIRALLRSLRSRIVAKRPGLKNQRHTASARRGTDDDADAALDAARLRTLAMHEWMIAGYTPRPSQTPVTLVWSSGEALAPMSTWTNIANVLETHTIPGTHDTCLSEHLPALIAHLESCLNQAQRG